MHPNDTDPQKAVILRGEMILRLRSDVVARNGLIQKRRQEEAVAGWPGYSSVTSTMDTVVARKLLQVGHRKARQPETDRNTQTRNLGETGEVMEQEGARQVPDQESRGRKSGTQS